ncbi:AfsR/SARP family transcriptional regulator [Streptomyces sp. S.PNR 29]|uniref:AfsR/SARP family transcriptional regulator n=1 Tax=Streptomyces sp. S.PNR 29 TaxID=2973805 RepID=UPI0025B0661E|nr:AfsR/SARP family transcriptional regulator [Streptomyces sp. S.PNR 29]MDN0197926.1 AfsR/SARP family transcriptional regulator [Streptomyces sp. S.PNR 29]
MQFRILGPVEIQDEHTGVRILPTGAKQRALLGALVVKAGHDVSVHRLIDELWGGHPPANAANALQAHVARLRRRLPRAGGAAGGPHEWIATGSLGYVLHLGAAQIDAQRFHSLMAQGRQTAGRDPGRAAELLRQALSLWRGPALEGSAYGDICAAEAAQLEEHRVTAWEMLYDALLRAGRHGEVTGELEELTCDHPLRERFYELLMVALYRCGRQAEALSVYERARKRLVHELGVEPGPALRSRMEAILHQDPALALPDASAALAAGQEGGAGPAAGWLGSEIARLNHRIEGLRLQQEHLLRRFEQLTAAAGGKPAGH